MSYTVGFVGTGPDPENPTPGEGFAMAYRHAAAYDLLDDCELHACADIELEHAKAFADKHGIAHERVFTDAEAMMRQAAPDIVSICTPVPTHAELVRACISANAPRMIHCEKPMATRWDDAREMVATADQEGVQLTINHQTRLSPIWQHVKSLIDEDIIGDVERIEVAPPELLDNGTHFIDRATMLLDDCAASWVLGGLDYRTLFKKYGAHNENQAISHWQWENGVAGLAATGQGQELIGVQTRVQGTHGTIEVTGSDPTDDPIRYSTPETTGWKTPTIPQAEQSPLHRTISHIIECFEAGTEPTVSASNALIATEIILGTYESVRRRGRVDLPLDIDDNPLTSLVESGELSPQ